MASHERKCALAEPFAWAFAADESGTRLLAEAICLTALELRTEIHSDPNGTYLSLATPEKMGSSVFAGRKQLKPLDCKFRRNQKICRKLLK